MKEPRNPDVIIKEINELNHLIENTQATLRQFPEDKLLQVALQQDLHRKKTSPKNCTLASAYTYISSGKF